MLRPGTVTGAGEWVEATSLARSIETAMVADGVIDLAEDTEESALSRRRTLAATARGIIDYFKASMDVTVDTGALRNTGEAGSQLPATSRSFTVSGGQITIAAGALRAISDTGVRVPQAARTLAGKVS
ncbi:MAG TPA: hypothetical protein VEW03_08175 [Longimicrobiaceae bacterium]|nr:hypothetical protein [Longimicrobiaceae bacterium]